MPGSSDPRFLRHFDGKRFYNPNAPQAPGMLDALRWKLTSRPEPSPRFISDVEQSTPSGRVESGALRITLVNHSTIAPVLGGVARRVRSLAEDGITAALPAGVDHRQTYRLPSSSAVDSDV